MKRTYFPGIIDVVVVTDPAEIRTISNDSRFDRDFITHGPVRNVQHLRKMLRIFSLNGRLFEPLLPRTSPGRAAAQDELWSRLKVKAELTARLQAIGSRLAQNLPPNQIQFRVKLIDVPTAEAFSIAGGHIYISRKIVAMTRSEDEMAGVLAHEMGHIVAHHAAIEPRVSQIGGDTRPCSAERIDDRV